VVFWCLDNSCFRALNAAGDLVAISKQKDKKFHLEGERMVAPFSLLNNVLRELKRAVDACGNRLVLIMEVVPRFLHRPCCEEPTHCSNTHQLDSAGVAAGKRILHDLADLNVRMVEYLSASNVRYISTGDLQAGADNCTMGELMHALYSCWSKDPVHGDKIAYHPIAMGLMDILSRKVSEGDLRNSLNPKREDGRTYLRPGVEPNLPLDTAGVLTTPPTVPTPATSPDAPAAPRAARAATVEITSRVVLTEPVRFTIFSG
jgi:hypothetical protein